MGGCISVICSIVDDLVSQGAVKGTLKGGHWSPTIYAAAQKEGVATFYRDNGYIGYDAATKLGAANPKKSLKVEFADGLALEDTFVSPALVQQLDETIEEALAAGWYVFPFQRRKQNMAACP